MDAAVPSDERTEETQGTIASAKFFIHLFLSDVIISMACTDFQTPDNDEEKRLPLCSDRKSTCPALFFNGGDFVSIPFVLADVKSWLRLLVVFPVGVFRGN